MEHIAPQPDEIAARFNITLPVTGLAHLMEHIAPLSGIAARFNITPSVTGLAHLMEHMAFKGTRRVGGKDWKQEGPLLDAQDEGSYQAVVKVYKVYKERPSVKKCDC